jgi:N-acetylmuramoyl-L-alanine amidase
LPSDPWESFDSPPRPRNRNPPSPGNPYEARRDEQAAGQRRRTRTAVLVFAGVLALVGGTALAVEWPSKGDGGVEVVAGSTVPPADPASTAAPAGQAPPPAAVSDGPATAASPAQAPATVPAAPATPPGTPAPGGKPLAGKTVVIDPGHNPGNSKHTAEIGRQVDAGGFRKNCDETGTETNAGYTEAQFTLDVANRTRAVLVELGAKVVFTWDNDRAWGPCVDERARIGNEAHADAVVSIHGDGAAASGTGFHVIVPGTITSGTTDTGPILGPSRSLGDALVQAFAKATATKPANYIGTAGIDVRKDLGGLNLSTVPKVFIECGNMRNSGDARRMTDPTWRQSAAEGIAYGIRDYLTTGSGPAR